MHMLRTVSTAAVLMALAAGSADAQAQGKGKPDKAKPQQGKVDPGAARAPAGQVRTSGQRTDPRAAARPANPGARGHAAAPPKGGTPPGLAKKGGLPPGQAKKLRTDDGLWALRDVLTRRGYTVTRLARYNDYRFVYYRTPDGIVRRAVVQPGAERLQFANVPGVVLREVIARLY